MCLDDKGEYGEAYLSLSFGKGDIIKDRLHQGVLTIVNQSGFLCFLDKPLWAPMKVVVMPYK